MFEAGLDISPAVQAGEGKNYGLMKIPGKAELQWQQSLGARRP